MTNTHNSQLVLAPLRLESFVSKINTRNENFRNANFRLRICSLLIRLGRHSARRLAIIKLKKQYLSKQFNVWLPTVLDTSCSEQSHCDKDLICRDQVCVCRLGKKYDETCLEDVSSPKGECHIDEQCFKLFGNRSVCHHEEASSHHGLCHCPPNHELCQVGRSAGERKSGLDMAVTLTVAVIGVLNVFIHFVLLKI